jgi:hypothetical protein
MKTASLLLAGLLAAAPALADEKPAGDATAAKAAALDLSLPKSATDYRNDPPGTWYGDTSGVPAAVASADKEQADGERCEGQLHGSVSAGVGYSSRGGNSNWQGANLHSCKTYYDDDGDAHEVGFSIDVGNYDGGDGGRRGGRRPAAPQPMGMGGPRR